jgi:uncharacterized protein involved in type VI secretion and phage assembly
VSRIVEIIRRVVLEELSRNRGSLLGVVTTIYPHEAENDENNYEVDVRLKHEDLELRRVPVAVGHIGVAAPPRAGDLVLVQFLDGDPNQALVTGRLYHADERPPLHFENEIRFTENGSILLQREVTEQEKNGNRAKASIKIDGESGNIEISSGENVVVILTHDDQLQLKHGGQTSVTVKDGAISLEAGGRTLKIAEGRVSIT